MIKNYDNYFTSGELSSLYQIPKQTLLYYDKIGLLKPAFISSNSYRHYNIDQYLSLEIILNLRRLDIPIAKIKTYLDNKSPAAFLALLEEKDKDCLNTIAELQRIHKNISIVKENIVQTQNIILEQILLIHEPMTPLCYTPIEKGTTGKSIIKMIARHVYKLFTQNQFSGKNVGWVVDKTDFFSENYMRSLAFYSTYDDSTNLPKSTSYIRAEGVYMTVAFKGTYYQRAGEIRIMLENFMQVNSLEPIGNIFIIPLRNHWLTSNTKEYINKLIIRVANKTSVKTSKNIISI
ncbi:MerR family transcriptional regulator [Pectinatus frisingensis]|uniref:MerR family transcriptional regulator n=1 Tax=Pectinatus frisingensis TaxID=865 RepID=UPI0018C5716A